MNIKTIISLTITLLLLGNIATIETKKENNQKRKTKALSGVEFAIIKKAIEDALDAKDFETADAWINKLEREGGKKGCDLAECYEKCLTRAIIMNAINDLNTKFDGIETTINDTNSKISSMESQLDTIENNIASARDNIKNHVTSQNDSLKSYFNQRLYEHLSSIVKEITGFMIAHCSGCSA